MTQMTIRAEAIDKILVDLKTFQINTDLYYDDIEPRYAYDVALEGKIKSLLAYCRALDWTELALSLESLLPLNGLAPGALDQINFFIIPEVRRLLATSDVESIASQNEAYWQLIHPRIRFLAQTRFEQGFYGDAVESSFKEVNNCIKQHIKILTGKELDGGALMNYAFSPQSPLITLGDLSTETGRNIQQGYMLLFSGSMTGIRNPKAHGNLNPSPSKAQHLICLASLLMTKFDERHS